MDEFVIQTDGLTKRYGSVVAVDGLSMEVRRGGCTGCWVRMGLARRRRWGYCLGCCVRRRAASSCSLRRLCGYSIARMLRGRRGIEDAGAGMTGGGFPDAARCGRVVC